MRADGFCAVAPTSVVVVVSLLGEREQCHGAPPSSASIVERGLTVGGGEVASSRPGSDRSVLTGSKPGLQPERRIVMLRRPNSCPGSSLVQAPVLWMASTFMLLGASPAAQVGTVQVEHKISEAEGGLGGVLDPNDLLGSSVAALGALDGDRIDEPPVGAPRDDDACVRGRTAWF